MTDGVLVTVRAALREAVEAPVTLRVRIIPVAGLSLMRLGLPSPTSAPLTGQTTVAQVPSEAAQTELPAPPAQGLTDPRW